MRKRYFTSEAVTEGHPDKICDQISDAVLDQLIAIDPNSRVACEVTVEKNAVHIMGEITSKAQVDYQAIARKVIKEIGYQDSSLDFAADTCVITCNMNQQSPDIALGVDKALESKCGDNLENGAGDQGMMFGYASDETEELMPLAISLAQKLVKRLAEVRKSGLLTYLRPDGKSQVTVEYHDDIPVRIDTIVISAQHDPTVDMKQLEDDIKKYVITYVINNGLIDDKTKFYINPTGRFVIGGPAGDTGLTGRKIIVDTYGGYAKHGGGAFSGKDPTKVDRSAAYMARYIAKNIVAAKLAKKCEVQLSYAIGIAKPISIFVDTFNTGRISDERIEKLVVKHFDLRPTAIIKQFDLQRPIYQPLAVCGHFGRLELDLPWEKCDKSEILAKEAR
ncbi:MAG: methionine adenosyltransferase [Erysipelotrichaceae bacterium]|nr:methionine adenosyltransferase [Erysipelotrichaceae bacterium]MDD4642088.1 methionine adenosyltransferase [Erysipelotrichaceae bacterium]